MRSRKTIRVFFLSLAALSVVVLSAAVVTAQTGTPTRYIYQGRELSREEILRRYNAHEYLHCVQQITEQTLQNDAADLFVCFDTIEEAEQNSKEIEPLVEHYNRVLQQRIQNHPVLQPTLATPGVPLPLPTSVSLAQPLLTQEQVLNQALLYDAAWSIWVRPWSKDTMSLEPARITIETYPNLGAESVARGFKGEIPAVDADSGPIWIVTIKGDVHVAVITPYPDGASVIYDGVTYVISQKTGNLLAIRTGVPKN